MIHYVVDASVAVKWVLNEAYAKEARTLLKGKYELLVPDLFFPEIGNIFWKKARSGEITYEEAMLAVRSIEGIRLTIYPSHPLIAAALEIGMQSDRTVYDSVYVALAVREDAVLITADERLCNALASGSLAARVQWLGKLA